MPSTTWAMRLHRYLLGACLIAGVGCESPLCATAHPCDESQMPERDSDADGISDPAELAYPTICVADLPKDQQYPARSCSTAAPCAAGETGHGLDPMQRDSDGDGIADGVERAACGLESRGPCTDPRLRDSDGDGIEDRADCTLCEPNVAPPRKSIFRFWGYR